MRTVFFLIVFLINCTLYAQQPCGTMELHAHRLKTDSSYAVMARLSQQQRKEHKSSYSIQQTARATANDTVVIPLVFHIFDSGEPVGTMNNPADTQIYNLVAYINASFAARWKGYPGEDNGGVNVPIRFQLAEYRNCGAVTSIERISSEKALGHRFAGINVQEGFKNSYDSIAIKYNWSTNDYYNIYLTPSINGANLAGFATFPYGYSVIDGTTVVTSYAKAGNDVLVHELGHALGLLHVFEGDEEGAFCPPDYDCEQTGDLICDTDPCIRYPNCNASVNPCTGRPYGGLIFNFMHYSNCGTNRFTPGQSQMMQYYMEEVPRNGLRNSPGLKMPAASVLKPATCIPRKDKPGAVSYFPEYIELNGVKVYFPLADFTDSGYVDYSCNLIFEANAGSRNTLGIQAATPVAISIFIDRDDNGILSGDEKIWENNFSAWAASAINDFTFPAYDIVLNKPLRMRMVIKESLERSTGACDDITTGSVLDYGVIIRPLINSGDNNVLLFPNPADDKIVLLSGKKFVGSKAHIYTPSGRVVQEFVVTGEEVVLDVSGLTGGVYFIAVFPADGEVQRLKFTCL